MQKCHEFPLEFCKHSVFSFSKNPGLCGRLSQDLCLPSLEGLQLEAEALRKRGNCMLALVRLCW